MLDNYAQILPMPAYIIYLRLFRLSHGFRQDRCRVSLRSLERSCGLVQKTIVRGLQTLLEEGFIKISVQGNVTQATEYQILIPAVADTAPALPDTAPLHDEIPQKGAVPETVIKYNTVKTTTTNHDELKKEIDFSSLVTIGFTDLHLKKLHQKHSSQMIQDSIDAFAFDLQFNRKSKSIKGGSALNFFMGIMMKGTYAPPENFKTKKQILEIQERERLKKIEHDEQLSKKEHLDKRRAVLKKIVDREFTRWVTHIDEAYLKNVVPPFAQKSENLERVYLRSHFEEKILKISLDDMSESQMSGLFQNINQLILPRKN